MAVHRVMDADIVRKVERMKAMGMDLGLDGQYGRFRVTNGEGGRNLSPRASNREILDWLDAYMQGWEVGIEWQIGEIRHLRAEEEINGNRPG